MRGQTVGGTDVIDADLPVSDAMDNMTSFISSVHLNTSGTPESHSLLDLILAIGSTGNTDAGRMEWLFCE